MMGKATETTEPSQWELTDYGLIAGEISWDQTKTL